MRHLAARCVLVLALLSSGTASLFAQISETATLTGHVFDSAGLPLQDATVSVDGPRLLGGPRIVTTDASGAFRAASLPAGSYRVVFSHDGFASIRTGIELFADATTTRDVRLGLSAIEETLSIQGDAGTVDVTTAARPTRIDRELLQSLPTRQVLSDVLNLAPGVNGAIGMGGVQRSNGMYIEGVNATDLIMGSPWVSFNYNWIDEVQVVAAGAGAQYGEFSGVVQKSRLRSGSDRFTGTAEAVFTRPSWVDTNTSSLAPALAGAFAARSQRLVAWHDENVDAGGPLIRGRAWAFGGVQTIRHEFTPALYAGPGATDEKDRRALARVDIAAASNLRVSGFYEYDRHFVYADGLGPSAPLETTTTDVQPNHNWSMATKWMRGSTAIELSFVGSGGVLTSNPTVGTREAGPAPHYDNVTGVGSGNTFYYQDLSSERRAVDLTLTRQIAVFGSTHLLDAGGQYEWARQLNAYGYPGGRLYLDRAGVPANVYLWPGQSYTDRGRRLTAYVQDRVPIGRLTLEPGVRVTVNTGLESQGRVLRTTPVSPRFGLAWDVAAAHDTVAAFHAGRYHDALLTPNFSFSRADRDPDEIYARVVGVDQFEEISRTTHPSYGALDPSISQAYFDQYAVSLERALRQVTMSTQLVWRNYRNFMGMIDRGTIFTPVAAQDPGPDNIIGTADDGMLLTVYRNSNPGHASYYFTNPDGFYRDYRAFQLFSKYHPSAGIEALASYTWARSTGNVENALRANAAGPELWGNGVAADPNRAINNEGANTFDFTHEVKVLGAWHTALAGGFTVSGVYRFHTGQAWGRSAHLPATNEFVTFGVRVEPRDARRTPALNTLDVRLEKQLPLGHGRHVGLVVDGFNVANQGIPDPETRRAIWEVSGLQFGVPQTWVAPRTARAAIRATF